MTLEVYQPRGHLLGHGPPYNYQTLGYKRSGQTALTGTNSTRTH
jgi:hypothetical protein